MKQLLYTLICAMFIPALMNAAIDKPTAIRDMRLAQAPVLQETSVLMKANTDLPKFLGETKTHFNDQSIPLAGFYGSIGQAGFLYDGSMMISYEPISGIATVGVPSWNLAAEKDTNYYIQIHPFINKGVNYDSNSVFKIMTIKDTVLGYQSMTTVNPNKSTSAKGLHYMVYVPHIYTRGNNWSTVYSGLFSVQPDKNIRKVKGPDEVTPKDYRAAFANVNSYVEGKNIHTYIASQPFANQGASAPHGAFHLGIAEETPSSFDFSMQTLFKTEFKEATATSHYNSKQMTGSYNNNIYAAFYNMFKEPASLAETRIPAVAKSTDGGYSFGALEKMPLSVLENYVTEVIKADNLALNEVEFYLNPFDDLEVAVYGDDKLSIVGELRIITKNPRVFYSIQYVEISKNAADWKIRFVENMTAVFTSSQTGELGKTTQYPEGFSIYDRGENDHTLFGVEYPLTYEQNDRSRELQLAVTEDGKYLVAKWVELNYDPANNKNGFKSYESSAMKLNPPLTANTYDRTDGEYKSVDVTSVEFTNIYVKYRKLDEETWSAPINVTNLENRLVVNTYMPKVIPSINSIPILYSTNFIPDPEKLADYWKKVFTNFLKLPDAIKYCFYDHCRSIRYASFNVEGKVNVETEVISKNGVAVFPNPAVSEMTIKIDNNTPATVEIFNMLGDKLMQFDNVMTVVPANVSGLANGMYVIKVNEGGKIRSSSFTIAR